jgi:hypothetical protein
MDKQEATFWIICFATLLMVALAPLQWLTTLEERERMRQMAEMQARLAAVEKLVQTQGASAQQGQPR